MAKKLNLAPQKPKQEQDDKILQIPMSILSKPNPDRLKKPQHKKQPKKPQHKKQPKK